MSNESEVFARPNDSAKIHDLAQFTLWAETPNRPGFRSRLQFGERNGAPRISVFTNAESGPKVLAVGMDPGIWNMFADMMTTVIRTNGPIRMKIENMQKDPSVTDKVTNPDNVAKVIKNTLHIGKTDEGVVYIAVEQKDAARIVFRLLPSSWHVFYKPDGQQMTREEASSAYASALLRALQSSMDRWISRLNPAWEPDPAKSKKPRTGVGNAGFVADDIEF